MYVDRISAVVTQVVVPDHPVALLVVVLAFMALAVWLMWSNGDWPERE